MSSSPSATQEQLEKAIQSEIPAGTVLYTLMVTMSGVVTQLQTAADHSSLKDDPQIQSQVSGRLITACKQLGELFQKYQDQQKEEYGEPTLVRQATLTVFLEKLKTTISDIEMPAEMAQLLLQSLTAEMVTFEEEVAQALDFLRKESVGQPKTIVNAVPSQASVVVKSQTTRPQRPRKKKATHNRTKVLPGAKPIRNRKSRAKA